MASFKNPQCELLGIAAERGNGFYTVNKIFVSSSPVSSPAILSLYTGLVKKKKQRSRITSSCTSTTAPPTTNLATCSALARTTVLGHDALCLACLLSVAQLNGANHSVRQSSSCATVNRLKFHPFWASLLFFLSMNCASHSRREEKTFPCCISSLFPSLLSSVCV